MAQAANQVTRTTLQLYRDCMRLAKHIGGTSKKGEAIKELVRKEFRNHKDETDPERIENLKSNAVRGLSNYLMMANAGKDKHLQSAMNARKDGKKEDDTEDNGPKDAEYREL